jgi:hypothetical protein
MYLSCASRTKAYFDEAANGRPRVHERSYAASRLKVGGEAIIQTLDTPVYQPGYRLAE